jgi:ribosomal protein S18 acetylase RimI-like enzyme
MSAEARRMPISDTLVFRPGVPGDADDIARISTGPVDGKRPFILDSFGRRSVVVACAGGHIVGYIIWDRAFFGRPFVWLLGVGPGCRRRGIASGLLHAFAEAYPGEGLFTSTNESNHAMQAVLSRSAFVPSGRVENLDPGDPELFYFKPPGRAVPT